MVIVWYVSEIEIKLMKDCRRSYPLGELLLRSIGQKVYHRHESCCAFTTIWDDSGLETEFLGIHVKYLRPDYSLLDPSLFGRYDFRAQHRDAGQVWLQDGHACGPFLGRLVGALTDENGEPGLIDIQ